MCPGLLPGACSGILDTARELWVQREQWRAGCGSGRRFLFSPPLLAQMAWHLVPGTDDEDAAAFAAF